MSAVAILRGPKPNALAAAVNRADTPWFAQHPERHHHVRLATLIERRLATCMHGRPSLGQDWHVAARRIGFGLVEHRFMSATSGTGTDFDEATAEWCFDGALIAGAERRA